MSGRMRRLGDGGSSKDASEAGEGVVIVNKLRRTESRNCFWTRSVHKRALRPAVEILFES